MQHFSTFRFDRWEDQTTVPFEIENSFIVVLACKKSFQFANEYSKQMFINQSCAFQARNRHRDKHMDYENELELDGFVDKMTAVTVLSKKNWWIKAGWYWICSILLLSWPYRLILKRNCCFTSINFVKELHVCSAQAIVTQIAGEVGVRRGGGGERKGVRLV